MICTHCDSEVPALLLTKDLPEHWKVRGERKYYAFILRKLCGFTLTKIAKTLKYRGHNGPQQLVNKFELQLIGIYGAHRANQTCLDIIVHIYKGYKNGYFVPSKPLLVEVANELQRRGQPPTEDAACGS